MALVLLGILNACVLVHCVVSGLVSQSSWLLLWLLICRLVQVLFFNLVINFLIDIFLLLPLE